MAKLRKKPIDTWFGGITLALLLVGLLVFISASLSLLVDNETVFYRILLSQIGFALIGGSAVVYMFSHVPYKFWQKYALAGLIASLIVTALVFVPGVGIAHGGARRWIDLKFITFQPAEMLKIGAIMYWSAWLAFIGDEVKYWKKGLLPLCLVLGAVGGVLLLQPDTGTFLVIAGAMVAQYFVAKAPIKHIVIMGLIALLLGGGLVLQRDYIRSRLMTFLDPSRDPLGSSYQIRQSLIAIGSGGLWGRGYGKSVQKYDHLPEPTGDTVFAVVGEELGLVGGLFLILLFALFGWRGLHIAKRAPDIFSQKLVVGFVSLIVGQSFLNIASITGIFPLTGLPLIFVSHGGTALLFALLMVGIILQISKYRQVTT